MSVALDEVKISQIWRLRYKSFGKKLNINLKVGGKEIKITEKRVRRVVRVII